jgi:hypothetical protein
VFDVHSVLPNVIDRCFAGTRRLPSWPVHFAVEMQERLMLLLFACYMKERCELKEDIAGGEKTFGLWVLISAKPKNQNPAHH